MWLLLYFFMCKNYYINDVKNYVILFCNTLLTFLCFPDKLKQCRVD